MPITRVLNAIRSREMTARGKAIGLRPEIRSGDHVRVGRGIRWRLEPGAQVILGDGCEIDDRVTIAAARGAILSIGQGAFIGHHSTVAARERVDIGAGTFCAEFVSIRDHDHDPVRPPSSGAVLVATVAIGSDCWIGAKVTVTRGVAIEDRVVVGANAVVTHDLPENAIAVGVPAAEISRRRK